MVGIDRIREYLGEFNANYVIIGGIACNLNLEKAELPLIGDILVLAGDIMSFVKNSLV